MVPRKPLVPPVDDERLADLERQVEEHNRRILALEKNEGFRDARIISLETAEQARRISEAVEKEREEATRLWRGQVEANFKDQRDRNSRLTWILIAAVAGAFLNFVLKGGLTLTP